MIRVLVACVLIATCLAPPVWAQQGPTDISGHWAEDRIEFLVHRNIADLFPDQTFRPNDTITRGEFVKWLVLSSGLPLRAQPGVTFNDVPPSHPLFSFIDAATAYGLVPRSPAFLPSAPMTRAEAVLLTVSALGYAFEATELVAWPSPYDDTNVLPDLTRGAIAVALVSDPPLLQEPLALSFRPSDRMTRAEAASLVGLALQAAEQGVRLHYAVPVVAGVELVVEKRGVLHTLPVWRVQIGAFASEENARRLADTMRGRGLPVFIDFQDGFYKVRVGSFSTSLEATLAKDQLGAEGYPTWVIQTLADFESLPGPVRTATLIIDPRAGMRLMTVAGDGQRMRRIRTSEIARRTGALAAINGGFFSPTTGDPVGCLMIAREVLSEPDPQRTCAGFTDEGAVLFDRVRFEASITTPSGTIPLDGVNRDRRADELILYRPSFDQSTRTNAFGAEAIVSGGVVSSIVDQRGNATIPRDGFVLSGHGRARQQILQLLQPGTPVDATLRFAPQSDDPRWAHVVSAVGGGPRLVGGGHLRTEGFPSTLVARRHPRTAIGVLNDGRIVLVVVDGRQPPHSLGMTIPELAIEMQRLGAVDAMNLDGGGSSTIVVAGRVVNLPSDEAGERPVASALVVLPASPLTPTTP